MNVFSIANNPILKWAEQFSLYQILDQTVRSFLRTRALESGASIAYYSFFSLFPMLIFLVSILGFFLKPDRVTEELIKLLNDFFPVSTEEIVPLIKLTLETVIDGRGPMSLIAGIGLLWSGSNVFTVVLRNINRAWGTRSAPMNFIQTRLMAIAIIGLMGLFIAVSLLINPLMELLSHLEFGDKNMQQTVGWWAASISLPYLFSFFFFFALYQRVPNARVHFKDAAIGAMFATLAWQGTIQVLKWALSEGFINYKLLFGSLTTFAFIMIWVYISSLILLFGAHLSATFDHRRDEQEVET
jgi:membrane protein